MINNKKDKDFNEDMKMYENDKKRQFLQFPRQIFTNTDFNVTCINTEMTILINEI